MLHFGQTSDVWVSKVSRARIKAGIGVDKIPHTGDRVEPEKAIKIFVFI